MSKPLSIFEGMPETGAKFSITGLGAGLEQDRDADPIAYEVGEELNLLVRVKIVGIEHDVPKKGVGLVRVHNAKALVVLPYTATDTNAVLDGVIAARAAAREMPGQSSLADLIDDPEAD